MILKDVNCVANAVLLKLNVTDAVGGMLCCVEKHLFHKQVFSTGYSHSVVAFKNSEGLQRVFCGK